jgi:hypothetical protein
MGWRPNMIPAARPRIERTKMINVGIKVSIAIPQTIT